MLQAAYDEAYEAHEQIITLGIYNMTTRENMSESCRLQKETVDLLETLHSAGGAMSAPCAGWLTLRPDAATASLIPGKTLFEILPEGAPHTYCLTVQGAVYLDELPARVRLMDASKPLSRTEVTVTALQEKEELTVLTVSAETELTGLLDGAGQLAISYDSPFYQALAPNNAFIAEDTVLTVENAYTDQRVRLKVYETHVKTAPGNNQYTPIISGLSQRTIVIVAWDRAIKAGDTVIIDE